MAETTMTESGVEVEKPVISTPQLWEKQPETFRNQKGEDLYSLTDYGKDTIRSLQEQLGKKFTYKETMFLEATPGQENNFLAQEKLVVVLDQLVRWGGTEQMVGSLKPAIEGWVNQMLENGEKVVVSEDQVKKAVDVMSNKLKSGIYEKSGFSTPETRNKYLLDKRKQWIDDHPELHPVEMNVAVKEDKPLETGLVNVIEPDKVAA
jgi:hypothetical protein